MELNNAISVPRALRLFPKKKLYANCPSTIAIGDCVYISSPPVNDIYQVDKADPSNEQKMPAAGVVIEKISPTYCAVQTMGEMEDIVTGLQTGEPVYVGASGLLVSTEPTTPIVQALGLAFASNVVFLFATGQERSVPLTSSAGQLVNDDGKLLVK